MSETAAPQVYTLVGFLRGKNTSGCFIERFKQGVSQGAAQEFSLARKNITEQAIAKLPGLNVNDEILYKTANYVIQDIEKKQPKSSGFTPRVSAPRTDPVIELNKNYSIIHEAVIDKAEKLVEFGKSQNMSDKQIEDMWALVTKLTIDGSSKIYSEIEKRYKWNGGSQ